MLPNSHGRDLLNSAFFGPANNDGPALPRYRVDLCMVPVFTSRAALSALATPATTVTAATAVTEQFEKEYDHV